MSLSTLLSLSSTSLNYKKEVAGESEARVVQIRDSELTHSVVRKLKTAQEIQRSAITKDSWWRFPPVLPIHNGKLLTNLPPLLFATPPYGFSEKIRIADFLGISENLSKSLFTDNSNFCVKCKSLTHHIPPEDIAVKIPFQTFAITARIAIDTNDLGQFSKVIVDEEVHQASSLSPSEITSSFIEVVVDRLRATNQALNERLRIAIKTSESIAKKGVFIIPWPPNGERIELGLETRCSRCGEAFAKRSTMLESFKNNIWHLDLKEFKFCTQLYGSIKSYYNSNKQNLENSKKLYTFLEQLEIDLLLLSTHMCHLTPEQQHLLAIARCLHFGSYSTLLIAPLHYYIPHKYNSRIIELLHAHAPPSAEILIAIPENLAHFKPKPTVRIFNDLTTNLKPGTNLTIQQSTLTLNSEEMAKITHVLPTDYTLKQFAHIPPPQSPLSIVASCVGLMSYLCKLYAKHPIAKARGLQPYHFGLGPRGLRCRACNGKGSDCLVCEGTRYDSSTHDITFKKTSLPLLLRHNVKDALVIMKNIPNVAEILKLLCALDLKYVTLNLQQSDLSCSEHFAISLIKFITNSPAKSCLVIPNTEWILSEKAEKGLKSILTKKTISGSIVVTVDSL
jgi:hypothetical protein